MSNESKSVKKKRRPKPIHDTNGYWMKGSNGGHTGRKPWIWTEDKLDELAEDLMNWVDENIEAKSPKFLIGDWCYKVKMIPQDLKKFVERSEKLKFAHRYAKGWQEHTVFKGALYKKLDSNMARFMLTCTHGWKENQDELNQEEALENEFTRFNKNMENLKELEDNE